MKMVAERHRRVSVSRLFRDVFVLLLFVSVAVGDGPVSQETGLTAEAQVFRTVGLDAVMRAKGRKETPLPQPHQKAVTMEQVMEQVGPDVMTRSLGRVCCNRYLEPLRERKNISIGVFGGSVTMGIGCHRKSTGKDDKRGACSWPMLLQELLGDMGWNAQVSNCAQSGTTPVFAADLAASFACGCKDMYVVGFGANADLGWIRSLKQTPQYERLMDITMGEMMSLVDTILRLPCRPGVLIWDEMPTWGGYADSGKRPGPRYMNAMVAHRTAAQRLEVGYASLFGSVYEEYVRRKGEAAFFMPNDVHQTYVGYLLMAGIVADYIASVPLSTADTESVRPQLTQQGGATAGSCQRVVVMADELNPKHVEISGTNFSRRLDPHGRWNWFLNSNNSDVRFQFHEHVNDVAVIWMRSYGPEWGAFEAGCAHDRRKPRWLKSTWWEPGSLFQREVVCSHSNSLTIKSPGGLKSQIRAVTFCEPQGSHRALGTRRRSLQPARQWEQPQREW